MRAPTEDPEDREVTLAQIAAPLQGYLDGLDGFLADSVEEFEEEMRDLVRYCLGNRGKRLRPLLLFASGAAAPEKAFPDLVRAAAVVEMVHLATLVHDDILDDATLRHRRETVSARYGNAVAVLLGDALFAQALKLAADFPSVEVCRAVSEATRRVCAGEIAQTFARRDADLEIAAYFRMIDFKTAELFAVSCALGADIAGGTEEQVASAREFGKRLGIAYQIYDDVADLLGREEKIGKTLGTDIASGKYTLPLLLLFQRIGSDRRERLIARLEQDAAASREELLEELQAGGVLTEVFSRVSAELDAAEAALERSGGGEGRAPLRLLMAFVRRQLDRLMPREPAEPESVGPVA